MQSQQNQAHMLNLQQGLKAKLVCGGDMHGDTCIVLQYDLQLQTQLTNRVLLRHEWLRIL